MFVATSCFSLLTLASGIIVTEKPIEPVKTNIDGRNPVPLCYLAKRNWRKVTEYLRLPFIYLPTLFIFLVVLAPGCDDAMFYFQTNVLHFDNTQMGIINVTCGIANIMGVWGYRVFFRNTPFKKMIVITTCCFSIA